MKKTLLAFLTLFLGFISFGQNDYKKRSALGVHFFVNDFQTPADIRTTSLAKVLASKQWYKAKRMSPGLAISYLQGLSNNLDFVGTLSGSFVNYPIPDKPLTTNNLLLEATATANLKLLSDKYWFTPFATLGAGASKYKGYYGAFIPAGIGLQLNIFDDAFLLVNSQYRIPVTETVAYHFYHSIGIAGNIGKKKEPAPVIEVPVPVAVPQDRDGDGVLDVNDKCPDVKGLASLQGCPDKDNDGITDNDDKCPDVAGLARYQGCPVPDTDKDGINDEQDKCPAVKGVARYQGCPVPDTDKDGVNDEDDKCIHEAGPASNFGCPVISQEVVKRVNQAAQNIFFATGSAKLLTKSYASLNNVVTILNQNPGYKVSIEGHTDITGKPDKNQILSENRAAAVKNYLISKGIDASRLTSIGYGQDKPIADNKTVAGRAKNRRVEMTLRNY